MVVSPAAVGRHVGAGAAGAGRRLDCDWPDSGRRAVAYGLALWKAPALMHAKGAQDRYDARVLVISVGGAVVVGAGLLYTARNYRLSHRGQITDRFTQALERLARTSCTCASAASTPWST